MEEISTTERETLSETVPSLTVFRQYLLNPAKSGLFGFAVFFSFLAAIKYISVFIGNQKFFSIDIADIALSALGFVLFSLIKFLENFRDKENN
ncbi:MAG: hypothetical protein ACM3MI_02970 [Clostridiales bacterium]